MSELQVLPLPEGFKYPFSPTQLQEMLSSGNTVTRLILFSGLAELFTPGFVGTGVVLCTVEAQPSGSSCGFNFEVNGVRADRIQGYSERLSQELLSRIRGWTAHKSQQAPPNDYQTPAKLNLVLEIKNQKFLIRSIVNG